MKYLGDSFTEAASTPNISEEDWTKVFGPKHRLICSKCTNKSFVQSNNTWHCKRCGASAIIIEDK